MSALLCFVSLCSGQGRLHTGGVHCTHTPWKRGIWSLCAHVWPQYSTVQDTNAVTQWKGYESASNCLKWILSVQATPVLMFYVTVTKDIEHSCQNGRTQSLQSSSDVSELHLYCPIWPGSHFYAKSYPGSTVQISAYEGRSWRWKDWKWKDSAATAAALNRCQEPGKSPLSSSTCDTSSRRPTSSPLTCLFSSWTPVFFRREGGGENAALLADTKSETMSSFVLKPFISTGRLISALFHVFSGCTRTPLLSSLPAQFLVDGMKYSTVHEPGRKQEKLHLFPFLGTALIRMKLSLSLIQSPSPHSWCQCWCQGATLRFPPLWGPPLAPAFVKSLLAHPVRSYLLFHRALARLIAQMQPGGRRRCVQHQSVT